jgi:eukaryotic-like serine/threonine-protein kinase
MKIALTRCTWNVDRARPLGPPGGFGSVYVGQGESGEQVAIKLLSLSVGNLAKRELDFAAALCGQNLENVIPVLDYGVDRASNQFCIVMAKAECSLADWLQRRGPCSETDTIGILVQLVSGLLQVGDWVHRDLKPGNALLNDGLWQIADFGIARIADANTATQTLKHYLTGPYAAPEQWDSGHATHATDVYALGCIAVELLTGSPPFNGPDHADFARQHRTESPQIPAVSPRMRSLLFRVLAKPAAGRPSLQAVLMELQQASLPDAPTEAGNSRLARVAAYLSEQEACNQATAVAAQRTLVERRALADHGLALLESMGEDLFRRIETAAPTAKVTRLRDRHPTPFSFLAQLGPTAALILKAGEFPPIDVAVFQTSDWDAVAYGVIIATAANYKRSASLWYMRDRSSRDDYHWIEAAYWKLRSADGNEPTWLPPETAAVVASRVMSLDQFAHPPRPIEGDNFGTFCARWVHFLADAAQNKLRRPMRLPED